MGKQRHLNKRNQVECEDLKQTVTTKENKHYKSGEQYLNGGLEARSQQTEK